MKVVTWEAELVACSECGITHPYSYVYPTNEELQPCLSCGGTEYDTPEGETAWFAWYCMPGHPPNTLTLMGPYGTADEARNTLDEMEG